MAVRSSAHRWRRGVSIAVAVLLTASALLAVAILLAGEPGPVQGRILGTTAILALFGILALPAAMLLDLGRARGLAVAALAADAAGAALGIAGVWIDDAPETLGRTFGSAIVVAVALAQVAALTARRRAGDPAIVGPLFAASTVLAAVVAAMMSWFIWYDDAGAGLPFRVMAALAVLDLLAAALQPVLARVRPGVSVRMQVRLAEGDPVEVAAEGRDLAAAVATGIRRAEGGGENAVAVDILERHVTA